VIILVADGARPDTLRAAMDAGFLPNLDRLRRDGGLHTVTTAWPSVTGVAYAPFLTGRFPGHVGLPGLRWFDRSRGVGPLTGHARSYVGLGMRHFDRDLDPESPTLFELAAPALGALSVISRGLAKGSRIGRGARFAARAASIHFRGDVAGWLAIDREVGESVLARLQGDSPQFVFAAFTGIDKASHAGGHGSDLVLEAMRTVDDVAGAVRHLAERRDTWEQTHLWIVSDHGHSPVAGHDDLASLFSDDWGIETLSHPWSIWSGQEAAVMVSGNAMAHVYLEPHHRLRPTWPALRGRWRGVVEALVSRPSVDLAVLPHAPGRLEVLGNGPGRGRALVEYDEGGYSYRPIDGDPLGIGEVEGVSARDAFDLTIESDYPDALVQVAQLARSPRAGDVILSAARGWDFRNRYEPIVHRSSHGALHRDHMLVPLLVNQPVQTLPRRTVDVMPSALTALGRVLPDHLDGESFVSPAQRLALSSVE